MKKIIFIALLCWAGTTLSAQSSEEIQKERTGYEQPYHPEEDGYMRINQLLQQAKKENPVPASEALEVINIIAELANRQIS